MLVSGGDWRELTVRPRRPRMVSLGAKRSDTSATVIRGPEAAGSSDRRQFPGGNDWSAMGKRNTDSGDDDGRLQQQQQLFNVLLYVPATASVTTHPAAAEEAETRDRNNASVVVVAQVPVVAVAVGKQLDAVGSDSLANQKMKVSITSHGEREFEFNTEQQQQRIGQRFPDDGDSRTPIVVKSIRLDDDNYNSDEKEGIQDNDDDDDDDGVSKNEDADEKVSEKRVTTTHERRKDAGRRPVEMLRMGRRTEMAVVDSDPVVVGDGFDRRMLSDDDGRRSDGQHDVLTGGGDDEKVLERYVDGMFSESDVDDDEQGLAEVASQSNRAMAFNGRRQRRKMNITRNGNRPVQLLRMGKRLAIDEPRQDLI